MMRFIPFKIRLIDDKVWFLFSVANILSQNKDFWVFWVENMKRPLYLFLFVLRVFFRLLEKNWQPVKVLSPSGD